MITDRTDKDIFTKLENLLDILGDGQYLVKWPGDSQWTFRGEGMISDYISKKSPHLVDYRGSSKINPYNLFCKSLSGCKIIYLIDGIYNFYDVVFLANEN